MKSVGVFLLLLVVASHAVGIERLTRHGQRSLARTKACCAKNYAILYFASVGKTDQENAEFQSADYGQAASFWLAYRTLVEYGFPKENIFIFYDHHELDDLIKKIPDGVHSSIAGPILMTTEEFETMKAGGVGQPVVFTTLQNSKALKYVIEGDQTKIDEFCEGEGKTTDTAVQHPACFKKVIANADDRTLYFYFVGHGDKDLGGMVGFNGALFGADFMKDLIAAPKKAGTLKFAKAFIGFDSCFSGRWFDANKALWTEVGIPVLTSAPKESMGNGEPLIQAKIGQNGGPIVFAITFSLFYHEAILKKDLHTLTPNALLTYINTRIEEVEAKFRAAAGHQLKLSRAQAYGSTADSTDKMAEYMTTETATNMGKMVTQKKALCEKLYADLGEPDKALAILTERYTRINTAKGPFVWGEAGPGKSYALVKEKCDAIASFDTDYPELVGHKAYWCQSVGADVLYEGFQCVDVSKGKTKIAEWALIADKCNTATKYCTVIGY